jgi:MFS superfamily sulfate permease-like transporter
MYMVKDVAVDGLIISIVAYAISISMCKIFATKHNYSVDANQELIAQVRTNPLTLPLPRTFS